MKNDEFLPLIFSPVFHPVFLRNVLIKRGQKRLEGTLRSGDTGRQKTLMVKSEERMVRAKEHSLS